jgi:hypothetical protein
VAAFVIGGIGRDDAGAVEQLWLRMMHGRGLYLASGDFELPDNARLAEVTVG